MLKVSLLSRKGFHGIYRGQDSTTGLQAVIAVHSLALGPSLGGIRMFPYTSVAAMTQDATRLAQAMSYKAAISALQLGGGKACILGNPAKEKTRDLFLSLGEFIETLGGNYIGAEDSGINPNDLDIVSEVTSHVTGSRRLPGGSGDPSPATAKGILLGIKTALQFSGNASLVQKRIIIQGMGAVGSNLARLLLNEGATVYAGDIDASRRKKAEDLGCQVVPLARLLRLQADVFAPCAMGAVLTRDVLTHLRCPIIAGGANNQFEDSSTGPKMAQALGILHAPDFVINAGGLIQLYVREILKKRNVATYLKPIKTTLKTIFEESRKTGEPPLTIAICMAQDRIRSAEQ